MLDREVHTIYNVMNFQYTKVIACSTFKCINGGEAKKKYYGFIKNTFRGTIKREDWQLFHKGVVLNS